MSDSTRDLIGRALSGDLTKDESNRLLGACLADEAARVELARLTVVERLLHCAHNETRSDATASEVARRLRAATVTSGRLVPQRNRWTFITRRVSWAVSALALVAICVWYGIGTRVAATVRRCEGVRGNEKPIVAQEELKAGRRVVLSSGLVEVEFQSGAVVVVEGPADLEVLGRSSAFLHRGRVVARVPEQAHGFTIESPRGRLIDLGTEFGVSVGNAGETEVHVLEGRVDAELPGRKTAVELRANEALRLTPEPTWMQANENEFVTEMPPRADERPPYIHWSFDEGDGDRAHNYGSGLADRDTQLALQNAWPGGRGPSWVPGRFGSALEFDGKGAFAECKYQGIPGRQARSIAAWVRVPKDFKREEGYGIVGWGMVNYPGTAWQLSANPVEDEGLLGRLRIGVSRGGVVGTTDLRDGEWHHLAVVMYGGARPNTATHVLVYVDGVLEPAPRKSVREIVTNTKRSKHGLWIGRNVATARSLIGDFSPGGAFFRGAVDEVFVVSGALSGEQIRRIMETNQL